MERNIPLLRFTIEHDYFSGSRSDDIMIQVNESSKKVFKNFDLALKRREVGQYLLFIKESNRFPELLKLLEEELAADDTALVFNFVVTKKRFFTITKNLPDIANSKRLLADVDLSENSSSLVFHQIDLTTENDSLNALFHAPNTLGIIRLSFTKTDVKNIMARNVPVDVSILFETKSAFWKYIFIPRSPGDNNLQIVESNDKISFSEIEWTTIHNNQIAGIAESKEMIKLSRGYPYKIQLWKDFANGRKLIFDQLPLPNPEFTESFTIDEDKNYHIHIYQYY